MEICSIFVQLDIKMFDNHRGKIWKSIRILAYCVHICARFLGKVHIFENDIQIRENKIVAQNIYLPYFAKRHWVNNIRIF